MHLLAVLILFACLSIELASLKNLMQRKALKRIAYVDALYGISAVIVLASGLYLALKVGKGADFYFGNLAIYIKLGVFVFVGLISIIPTIFFIKQSKGEGEQEVEIPQNIKRIIISELILILCLPAFGVLLANNILLF